MLAHRGSHFGDRLAPDLEHQLVVHLHDEPRRRVRPRAPFMQGDHRALDDVRRRPLHRGIDGGALGALAQLRVSRADIRQVQPPAEHRLDVAGLACLGARLVHEALHTRVAPEVTLHVLLCGAALDA